MVDDEINKKNKRKWSKQWLLESKINSYVNLLRELETKEPADLKYYLCMDTHTFYDLLNLVQLFIEKQNTMMCENIPVVERLVACTL